MDLEKAEFEADVFGDAVDGEGRFPDEFDVGVFDAGDIAGGLFDLARKGSGDGAGGGCEGHSEVYGAVGVDVDPVDETKVVDVDRDFGVVDRADGFDDFSFEQRLGYAVEGLVVFGMRGGVDFFGHPIDPTPTGAGARRRRGRRPRPGGMVSGFDCTGRRERVRGYAPEDWSGRLSDDIFGLRKVLW